MSNYKSAYKLVLHQINNMFMLTEEEKCLANDELIKCELAYNKTLICLENSGNWKYFSGDINLYNSVMYCIFLYWYSKGICQASQSLGDKVYYLNKALNAVDLFYDIDLPDIWFCEHPIGSVMGRARYGNKFIFYQNCTVGGSIGPNRKDVIYPVIGQNVIMYSYSRIIGNCKIGSNCVLASGTAVINQDVPDNSIVFGQSPNLIIKSNRR